MLNDNDAETMYFCTERGTNYIFEVKYFDDFVIVRPADPSFYKDIRKHNYMSFCQYYEEYCGSMDQLRQALNGDAPVTVIN